MRQTLFLFMLVSSIHCLGQAKYIDGAGIVERTSEFENKKTRWIALKDKESVDGYTRIGDSVFGGEVACNVKPLSDIDISSFQVFPGTKYARDKNHVYFPIEIRCVDYEDCGVCYYEKVIVEKAEPSTFNGLGKEYGADGKLAFFRGRVIEGADGATFRVVETEEDLYFATDKNHVYTFSRIFNDADPATFHIVTDSKNSVTDPEKYIVADGNNEWEFTPPRGIKKVK